MTLVYQLKYEDKHDTHYAIFASYEAAGEEVIEVIKKYLSVHPGEFLASDVGELEGMMARKAYQQLMDFWNEHTQEYLNIEDYEVQGKTENMERRNVHAVLSSMAAQVLIEEVTAIQLDWRLGEPVTMEVKYLSKYPLQRVQLDLGIVDENGDAG